MSTGRGIPEQHDVRDPAHLGQPRPGNRAGQRGISAEGFSTDGSNQPVTGRRDSAQTDHWGGVASMIVVDDRFGDDCLLRLGEFSHAEIIFMFHLAAERAAYQPHRRRGRPDLPEVGVFADHGPRRPIGATICQILTVTGRQLTVRGLDAVVGTPSLTSNRPWPSSSQRDPQAGLGRPLDERVLRAMTSWAG